MRRQLLRDDQRLPVRAKTFDTLLAFVESGGKVLDKTELISKVWGGAFVEESGLARNISELRKLLGETPHDHCYIVTVPGIGYRFIAPVSGQEEAVAAPSTSPVANGPATGPRQETRFPPTRSKLRAAIFGLTLTIGAFAAAWTSGVIQKASRPNLPPVRLRPLTANPGIEVDPSFSPDGRQIAYAWDGGDGGNLDIYIKLLDAGAPLRLTSDAADDRSPAWSPDGRYIAFLRYSPKQVGVFIIPALGGSPRQVLQEDSRFFTYAGVQSTTPGAVSGLAWYPDGKSLAVGRRLSENGPNCIVALSVETGETRRITSPDGGAEDNFPAISPDGKTLAFVRSHGLGSLDDIFLIPAAGGQARPLIRASQHVMGLAWNAGGNEIVFSSDRGGSGYSLWRVSLAGGTPELLTAAGRDAYSPTLSLGSRLAYTESSVDTNIWRVNAPGATLGLARRMAAPRKLIASAAPDDSPQFSPDGRRIVFVSGRSGCQDVWVCDRDGSNARRLTSCFGSGSGTPRWSPDGRQIAFDSSQERADIFVVSAEGGVPRRLTSTGEKNVMPSWSRDGRWIYFRSVKGADSQIWKMPAAGGIAVQVTRNGGFEGFESPDGRFLYYTKDRGPGGIWRVPSGGGEEIAVPELGNAGYWRYWAVHRSGIYFVPHETPAHHAVSLFDHETRKVTRIAGLEQEPLWWLPGLDVSPDGHSILYLRADVNASAIRLVENFR